MLTYCESNIALGCRIDLTLISDADEVTVEAYFRQLWLCIFQFEKRCSRFLPASELSSVNRMAGVRHYVSPELHDVLVATQRMAVLSEGLYNPFILPALQRAGYVHSVVPGHETDTVDVYEMRAVPDADTLVIGDDWVQIPYGSALDLGGCGKGYCGDLLADLADTFSGVTGYWFSLGGDIVSSGFDEHGKPRTVGIAAEFGPRGALAANVRLPDGRRYAVASSATSGRTGIKHGKPWHHIIDPRTEKPAATDVVRASVCARSLLVADVFASCAIIAGSEQARTYLETKHADGAVLQSAERVLAAWGPFVHRPKA